MKIHFLPILLSLLLAVSCNQSGPERSNKFTQYYNRGTDLYVQHCSNCHQVNGQGLGRLYPPLNKSDFMQNNFEAAICLIRYGRSGSMTVNGVEYNKEMPGVSKLTDLEIAEIATYIFNAWDDNKKGIIDVRDATTVLSKCAEAH
jgi:cytochrome c551